MDSNVSTVPCWPGNCTRTRAETRALVHCDACELAALAAEGARLSAQVAKLEIENEQRTVRMAMEAAMYEQICLLETQFDTDVQNRMARIATAEACNAAFLAEIDACILKSTDRT